MICHWKGEKEKNYNAQHQDTGYYYAPYAALLPRRGPHIASHSVCLSVCPSVPFAEVVLQFYSRTVLRANILLLFLFTFFTVEPSYERTSKIEKLLFSVMGQRHVCTFRHAQRAAYRTAISAAQTCYPRRARSALGVDTVLTLDVCLYVCLYVC